MDASRRRSKSSSSREPFTDPRVRECGGRDKSCGRASSRSPDAGGRSRPSDALDGDRPNDWRLRGGTYSRALPNAARGRGASPADGQRFANDGAGGRVLGGAAVGFEDEHDRLLEVGAGFLERPALRVGAGQLLDKPDEPFGDLLVDRRELKRHDCKYTGATPPPFTRRPTAPSASAATAARTVPPACRGPFPDGRQATPSPAADTPQSPSNPRTPSRSAPQRPVPGPRAPPALRWGPVQGEVRPGTGGHAEAVRGPWAAVPTRVSPASAPTVQAYQTSKISV